MTEIVTAHNPEDLIELLPTLMGFTPIDSLVIAVVGGERRRIGVAARFDLDDLADEPDLHAALNRHMLGTLQRVEAKEVLLLAVHDDTEKREVTLLKAHEWLTSVNVDVVVRFGAPNIKAPSARVMDLADRLESSQMLSTREQIKASFAHRGGGEDHRFTDLAERDDFMLSLTMENAEVNRDRLHQWATTCPVLDADLYALLGLASWLTGDGARALMALEQSATIDPNHTLTRLIFTIVTSGINPNAWEELRSQIDPSF